MQTERNRLIVDHTAIARRIALRLARNCPAHIAREDLVSAGMLGLIEAADRYDDSRREPFVAFAEHRIRGAVLDELRRGDFIPRRARQLARKIDSTVRELEQHGERATDERVAFALGVTVDAYRRGMSELVHVSVQSLGDTVLVDHDAGPDEQAEQRVRLDRVRGAVTRLAPRDARILELYFVEELTYQQIADSFGITPSRVCQLLWRAVDKLRTELGAPAIQEAA